MTTMPKNAQALVGALTHDFAADGKKSCRECLRSKIMPSKRVSVALEVPEYLSASTVLEAHEIVSKSLCSPTSTSASHTALQQINKLATAIRFLQLLLHLPPCNTERFPLDQRTCNTSQEQSLSSDRRDQVVQKSFSDLSGFIARLITADNGAKTDGEEEEECDPMTLDASCTDLDGRPAACFAFVSILRLYQTCKSRKQWMAPLCNGLCDIATACHKAGAHLPHRLTEDAIRMLSKLLEEGTLVLVNHIASMSDPKITSPSIPLEHHNVFASFVCFLMLRVVSLLQVTRITESKDSAWVPACRTLTVLCGLPDAFLMHAPVPGGDMDMDYKNHINIANKAEKQIMKICFHKPGKSSSLVNANFVKLLLGMKIKRATSSPSTEVLRKSQVLGRAILSKRILQKTTQKNGTALGMDDVEILLKLCESFHSIVLPEVFGTLLAITFCHNNRSFPLHQFLHEAMEAMVTVLLIVEGSLASMDGTKLSQFHRIFIRWMAPPKGNGNQGNVIHPLSREFIISLIYVYLVMHGEDLHPLATLATTLLFDPRTTQELRKNLSELLCRIMSSRTAVGEAFGGVVEALFADVWKDFSNHDAQRKRKRDGNRAGSGTMHAYLPEDVELIGRVLACIPSLQSMLLRNALEVLVDEKGLQRIGQRRVDVQLKSISLLLWYMQSVALVPDTAKVFPKQKLFSSLQQTIDYTTSRLRRSACVDGPPPSLIPLLRSVLNLCRAICGIGLSEGPVHIISVLVADTCSEAQLQTLSSANNRGSNYHAVFDCIALLGPLANCINADCPKEALGSIRGLFQRLLSTNNRNVYGPTLRALVAFGHNIEASHASLLPSFLPKTRLPQFKARAQNMVWDGSKCVEVNNSSVLFQAFGASLEVLTSPCRIQDPIFPNLSAFCIVPGSFFLQMPTQGGRQALVIFPPGEQSITDIRCMLELSDGDAISQLQFLKKVTLLDVSGEEGCKCILQESVGT